MENFTLMHSASLELDRKKAEKEFASDIKKHINDISRKYILPEEGTMDFALMYIPSEAVYYELVNISDVMEHARKERVYPVSPNTLYAHLQLLLVSFQGKAMEEKSKEVFTLLRAIQKDYKKLDDQLATLNKHVVNAYNSMSSVSSGYAQMGQKLSEQRILKQA
jgi:DNA recombination protein RmuC